MAKTAPRRLKIADPGGDTISVSQLQDGLLILTPMENFDVEALKAMPLRDDDVILCSYPRSGCHWLWEQMRMLHAGSTDLNSAEKQSAMFENNSVEKLQALAPQRTFNTHVLYDSLPTDVRRKGTKLVLIYRHPKDVAVSFYHLHRHATGIWEYTGQFCNWLQLFMDGNVDWGSYHDYLNDWAKVIENNPDLNIHVLTYEGLKKAPVQELGRLSRFLGLDHDDAFLKSVSDACSIELQRKRKGNYWDDKGVDDSPHFMYRKGKSGGWKEEFTVAMNERFDQYWSQAFKSQHVFPIPQM